MDNIKNNKRGLEVLNSLSVGFQICSQIYFTQIFFTQRAIVIQMLQNSAQRNHLNFKMF